MEISLKPGRLLFGALGALALAASAFAQPATPDDVVIWAREDASVRRASRLVVGHIVVNDVGGTLRASRSFEAVDGTQIVTDTLKIRRELLPVGPTVNDLFANQVIDADNTLAFQPGGSGPTPIALPLMTFPSAISVTPGVTDVTVLKDTPVVLPPGDYGIVRIRARGTLFLEGGTYNVKSLLGGLNSRIYFFSTGTLNVADKFRVGSRSVIGPPSEVVLSPRCININTASSKVARIGNGSNVDATVSAPLARLRLGGFTELRGQFIGRRVLVGFNAVMEAAPPLGAPCP